MLAGKILLPEVRRLARYSEGMAENAGVGRGSQRERNDFDELAARFSSEEEDPTSARAFEPRVDDVIENRAEGVAQSDAGEVAV